MAGTPTFQCGHCAGMMEGRASQKGHRARVLSRFCRVRLSATPWTAAHRRLLCPWGFSRQEHWSGLPCPPPGDLCRAGDGTHVSCTGGWVLYPLSHVGSPKNSQIQGQSQSPSPAVSRTQLNKAPGVILYGPANTDADVRRGAAWGAWTPTAAGKQRVP